MNTSTKLLTGLLALGLTLGPTASAVTTVYIVGSNGDRTLINTAIPNILVGETFAGTNATVTKSNYSAWTGGTLGVGGPAVDIKVSLIGATGAIAAVAGSLTVPYLPPGATGTANADPTVAGNAHEDKVPEIAFSTNFVSTTPYNGTYQGHVYENISPSDRLLAVVGLKVLASKNYPYDNLTTQQAQYLYGSGAIPLSFFSGLAADETKTVYAIGRNQDSGQRYAFNAETGIGINGVVKQWKPVIASGAVTSQALWPIENTYAGSSGSLGNGGYDTGSNEVPTFNATLTGTPAGVGLANGATVGYYIGYATPGDAATVLSPNGSAVELKYNGTPYSDANIQEGRYTLWVYEHILKRASISNLGGQVYTAVGDQIRNVDATAGGAGINLDTVAVKRTAEGANVTSDLF